MIDIKQNLRLIKSVMITYVVCILKICINTERVN